MNCKPGDLVVVVRSEVGNDGRFGVIVGPANSSCGLQVYQGDDWVVSGRFITADEMTLSYRGTEICSFETNRHEVDLLPFPDKNLKPIRDNNGEDETLTWAGKPEGVKA